MDPKPLINPDEGEALEAFAREVAPGTEIVEIGTWAGTSAERLSAGAPEGVHITCVDVWVDWIDPPADQYPVTGADAFDIFCSRVDPAKVTPLKARSLDVAAMWTKPIGLLFIDASHTFEDAAADYEAWSPFVVAGGVLAVHDYAHEFDDVCWWTEGPTQAVEEVIEPSGLWSPLGVVGWTWTARRV